jgi:hypothetical protein
MKAKTIETIFVLLLLTIVFYFLNDYQISIVYKYISTAGPIFSIYLLLLLTFTK